ncbi:MAG: hypothetical protein CSA82_02050 [Actinobacteria bacterium]|nr:MAG: hypothetical protein CSA82_02050 [Actinomycetota bacterium]
MDVTVSAHGTTATLQLLAGMVTARFTLEDGREIDPFYTAAWEGWTGVPLLEKLRGDFLCVPFGDSPASVEGYPAEWSDLVPGASTYPHGFCSNGTWEVVSVDDEAGVIEVRLAYPESEEVSEVYRCVECHPGRVDFIDTVRVRWECALPIGLHPIFSLPDEVGAARVILPKCAEFMTKPLPAEPTSLLAANTRFHDPTAAPQIDNGTTDITRLPFDGNREEIVLACVPETAQVSVENHVEGYRATVTWDGDILKNVLLWISNRGRDFEPWGGENVCLGVEPVSAAFDLGSGISAADNPVAAAGYATTVKLHPGEDLVIRHSVSVEAL